MTGATGQVIRAVISDRFRGGRRKSVLIAMMCGGAFICFVAGLIGKTWPALFFAILAGIMGATILAYAPIAEAMAGTYEPTRKEGSPPPVVVAGALGDAHRDPLRLPDDRHRLHLRGREVRA